MRPEMLTHVFRVVLPGEDGGAPRTHARAYDSAVARASRLPEPADAIRERWMQQVELAVQRGDCFTPNCMPVPLPARCTEPGGDGELNCDWLLLLTSPLEPGEQNVLRPQTHAHTRGGGGGIVAVNIRCDHIPHSPHCVVPRPGRVCPLEWSDDVLCALPYTRTEHRGWWLVCLRFGCTAVRRSDAKPSPRTYNSTRHVSSWHAFHSCDVSLWKKLILRKATRANARVALCDGSAPAHQADLVERVRDAIQARVCWESAGRGPVADTLRGSVFAVLPLTHGSREWIHEVASSHSVTDLTVLFVVGDEHDVQAASTHVRSSDYGTRFTPWIALVVATPHEHATNCDDGVRGGVEWIAADVERRSAVLAVQVALPAGDHPPCGMPSALGVQTTPERNRPMPVASAASPCAYEMRLLFRTSPRSAGV